MSQHTPTRLVQRLKGGRTGDPLVLASSVPPEQQVKLKHREQQTVRGMRGGEPGPSDCACHPSAQALLSLPENIDTSKETAEMALARGARNLGVLGIIVLLNVVTMTAELATGYASHSVSLTADGWHMVGHTVALGLTYFVMRHLLRARAARSTARSAGEPMLDMRLLRIERFTGLANAGLLVAVGAFTVFDAVQAFTESRAEDFKIALGVACVGLVVNVAGGVLLQNSHDKHNVAERGMYLHILSDALMSLLAIGALAAGFFAGVTYADPVVGVLGGLVILKWGASLFAQGLRK
ncbi:MAG: cation transporter [Silvanigrellales bacterium]|nr:cation transporter [Silvanigrellales bacterium]